MMQSRKSLRYAVAPLLAVALGAIVGFQSCAEGKDRQKTVGGSSGGAPSGKVVGTPTEEPGGIGDASEGEGEGTGGTSSGGSDQFALVAYESPPFEIFSYEATVEGGKAVSRQNASPTVSINFAGADAACAASGYRLCTLGEWQAACKGQGDLRFAQTSTPEGPPDIGTVCDVARETNNGPGSLPSSNDDFNLCVTTGLSLYNMIGNASEWAVGVGDAPVAAGAAFYQALGDSHCDATLSAGSGTMPPETATSDLGFRCCRDP